MTSNQTKPLLTPTVGGGWWRDTAIIGGGREDDGALAAGYLEAARAVVEHWEKHRPNDQLVVPILALYRHGIELALKDGIRTAAACARRDGVAGPDLAAAKLDEDLAKTHSLGRLVQKLTELLDLLKLGEEQKLPADTLAVLQSLHVLDESGQTFRYATVKVGSGKARTFVTARPDQVHFDLPTVASRLDEVAAILLHGLSGVLEAYQEFQDEMREYADSFTP